MISLTSLLMQHSEDRSGDALAAFLKKVDGLSKISDTKFTFTISTDLEDLPEAMFEYCEKLN